MEATIYLGLADFVHQQPCQEFIGMLFVQMGPDLLHLLGCGLYEQPAILFEGRREIFGACFRALKR